MNAKPATLLLTAVLTLSVFSGQVFAQGKSYFPPAGSWQTKAPAEMGLNGAKLSAAVEFAMQNEYSGSKDLRIAILNGFRREPFHTLLGPVRKRGGPAGLVLKNGYVVSQWGDLDRVDMTFSVTKSYLSTVAGIAFDRGLISDVNAPVGDTVWDGIFGGAHNSKVTWQSLLNQSSDWSGELFGIKDWADRPPRDGGIDDWQYRERFAPEEKYEYNDVRVNVLAYSLLQTLREPLPKVLKDGVMDPIGASTTWRWFGYEDAWVTLDGMKMKSVTGGGHSGGGVFVSTWDQARFGLMAAHKGRWGNAQIVSEQWFDMALLSSKANASYGYMWWLNRGERKWEQVDDESIYYAAGFGGNFIVIDNKNDLVMVTRWLEPRQIGEFVNLVRAAVN